ncbi:hypothetical protein A2335_05055 [Candidatus Peregrinibacteria bacterium RIFOXYB2_FULL_32_7]|nr:MAG: hypothetical protein A2335_05055 [Candidatus Peregrinibacteria bacterium RIFOXYB2_FULL_32_7]
MNFEKGDIVLVPFPFTDLSSVKTRPALVIYSKYSSQDLILLAISSQKSGLAESVLESKDLKNGILPVKSYVKYTKITILYKGLVKKKVASLKKSVINEIINLLKGEL